MPLTALQVSGRASQQFVFCRHRDSRAETVQVTRHSRRIERRVTVFFLALFVGNMVLFWELSVLCRVFLHSLAQLGCGGRKQLPPSTVRCHNITDSDTNCVMDLGYRMCHCHIDDCGTRFLPTITIFYLHGCFNVSSVFLPPSVQVIVCPVSSIIGRGTLWWMGSVFSTLTNHRSVALTDFSL